MSLRDLLHVVGIVAGIALFLAGLLGDMALELSPLVVVVGVAGGLCVEHWRTEP